MYLICNTRQDLLSGTKGYQRPLKEASEEEMIA